MSFTDEMKKIGDNIATSYDIRVSSVGDIIKDTHSTLNRFHTEQKHMSEEQRSELEHFVNELRKTTKSMLNEFNKEHKEMANELRMDLAKVHKMLNEFNKEHKEMANELRMDLAKVPKMLKDFMDNFLKAANQFHNMLASYYKEEIKQPTQKMLSDLRRENDRAHQTWMSVSRAMAAKRGRKPIAMERMNKPEQICSILASHPSGMTPGMIAKEMGCSAQSIKSALQGLKNQGRISKKQNKFFPK